MWEPVVKDYKLGPDGTLFLGLAASVWIDVENQQVKKSFAPGLTVAGENKYDKNNSLEFFFKNELEYVNKLSRRGTPRVSKIIDFDEPKKELLYEYIGPDLLTQINKLSETEKKTIHHELIKMFEEYAELDFFKFNGGSHNMSWDGNRLLAFDFKWCEPQKEYTSYDEVYALLIWLGRFFPKSSETIVENILKNKFPNLDHLVGHYYFLDWTEGFESPFSQLLRPNSAKDIVAKTKFIRFLLQDNYELFGVAATRLDCNNSNKGETLLVQHGISHLIYITTESLDSMARKNKLKELHLKFVDYDIFPVQVSTGCSCDKEGVWSLRNSAAVDKYIKNEKLRI